ncbi:MAG: Integral rane sensor signal transduction histidine kinase [Verrucomicrobiales bacterium]|nr:Integral rane sensor signal transduction histidine kinase [Verrucomicrobiales bacterium]
MVSFKDLSLNTKQRLIIMLISSISLLMAFSAFSVYEVISFRKEMVRNLSTLAEIVGDNTSAALDFNNSNEAEQTLGALAAEPGIIGACIYRTNGVVFASYDRVADDIAFEAPTLRAGGHVFERQRLILSRPITHKGETIGIVYLESDMKALSSRLKRYLAIVGIVFLAAMTVALLLSNRLQRLVSDPILNLAGIARQVAVEKNYGVRAKKKSDDELGQLVDGFNAMLEQIQTRDTALETARDNLEKRVEERTRELESAHKQLMEASRRGGMAEIATNVLHNVGNVLNSVNVSTGLIVDSVKKSKVLSLGRLVALLKEHEADIGTFVSVDPKGKQLPAYLGQLSEHLMADQKSMMAELESLRVNIEHIKEIVAMQQSYATFGGVKESISPVNLVEDSLRMHEGALSRHHVAIVRQFEEVRPINMEKHKVLQILVNLLRNAKHACQETDKPGRQVTIRVFEESGLVKISISDNGVGIPQENLTRIFNHGFTTRKDGHGFGLHSGALAAKEMGGALIARSDGPGLGACFTLELPAH